MKLNVLLAKTDHSAAQFKALIKGYIAFFKTRQGEFQGIRRTYTAREGTIDEPTMRATHQVVTTVDEKLFYLQETSKEYIDNLFMVEATNSSGTAVAKLELNGVYFGTFSSLELLRLKSLLESSELEEMYAAMPVRKDDEIWEPATDEAYKDRQVVQTEMIKGVKKGVTKEQYILVDPNVQYLKDASKYVSQVVSKDTVTEFGDYTMQKFSGETTHHYRAEVLRRRSALLGAVIVALKIANEVEAVKSDMTAEKIFAYLHKS